jgi:hypothetical protein
MVLLLDRTNSYLTLLSFQRLTFTLKHATPVKLNLESRVPVLIFLFYPTKNAYGQGTSSVDYALLPLLPQLSPSNLCMIEKRFALLFQSFSSWTSFHNHSLYCLGGTLD